jgi:hypothetical protein
VRTQSKPNPIICFFALLLFIGIACSQTAAPPGSPPQSNAATETTSAGVGAVPPLEIVPSATQSPSSVPSFTPALVETNTPIGETPVDTLVQTEMPSETPVGPASETPFQAPSVTQNPIATIVETQSSGASPTIQVPEISTDRLVLSDNFNGGGPWAQGSVEGSFEFGYTEDTYRFVVQVPYLDVWSIRNQTYSNLRQDIVIASFAGATDGFTGVVCRWNGSNNYYRLTVDASGLFRITRIFSAEIVDIASASGPDLAESVGIPYRLRAECNRDFLALYLNDTLVVSAQDNFFDDGNFGIVTGTLVGSPFTAEIDSFDLYLP